MSKISNIWKELPLLFKILFPIGLIVLLFSGSRNFLTDILEQSKRDKVDKENQELEQERKDLDDIAAYQEGKLDNIENEKKEAREEAKDDDSISFHNNNSDDN